jgi:hypothetical protein
MDRHGTLYSAFLTPFFEDAAMNEHVSVPTRIKARFRRTAEREAPRSGPGFRTGDASLRDLPAAVRPPEALIAFLLEMDRKLDAILGYLHRETLEEEFPGEGWVTELSGVCLTLETAASLETGDRLELALLLEEFPPRMVSVTATVESPRPGERGPEAFCLACSCAREEDRETLIRFVFQEERRLLRLRKGE